MISANAASLPSNDHYTIEFLNHQTIVSVDVSDVTAEYEVLESQAVEPESFNNQQISEEFSQFDLILDQIINIGKKIWNIVEKGKPVSSFTSSTATALPANSTAWEQLQSWKMPKTKVIRVSYKNVYGSEVVKFTYRIVLLYGGNVKGKGQYIGYATIEPVEMTTSFMYTFNAGVQINAVFNMGTKANPIGGILLGVNWTVETALKKITETHTYTLDGTGNIQPAQGNLIFGTTLL